MSKHTKERRFTPITPEDVGGNERFYQRWFSTIQYSRPVDWFIGLGYTAKALVTFGALAGTAVMYHIYPPLVESLRTSLNQLQQENSQLTTTNISLEDSLAMQEDSLAALGDSLHGLKKKLQGKEAEMSQRITAAKRTDLTTTLSSILAEHPYLATRDITRKEFNIDTDPEPENTEYRSIARALPLPATNLTHLNLQQLTLLRDQLQVAKDQFLILYGQLMNYAGQSPEGQLTKEMIDKDFVQSGNLIIDASQEDSGMLVSYENTKTGKAGSFKIVTGRGRSVERNLA